ncbi:MAG: Trypsin [Chthoniobacteraceae bacterium]|nr:Trypsin [Chthoniobacteraceae bacterium]
MLLAGVARSQAVIVFGSTESDNLIAPLNGAPWKYVARLDENNASGVYLGNGFLLTANHVSVPATALINGGTYLIDSSYAPFQIGGADIKLLRILGDPQLAPLSLIEPGATGLNKASTIIGWGVGKGSEVANQGWNWSDNSSRAERWGSNTTLSDYYVSNNQSYLLTSFDRFQGNEEAAVTIGDSGSALFQKFGTQWELAGITSSVETGGQSLYDHDPLKLLDQPDHNFFIPIALYRDSILAATAAPLSIPEPSSRFLLLFGSLGLWFATARRRPLTRNLS